MNWQRLTTDLHWKLGAVALSSVLWFVVVGEPELVTIEAVPLVFRNLPRGMLLVSDPPDSVRVEVRGPSASVARENLSDLKILLDLAEVQAPGERSFTLSETEVRLPHGVNFVRAVPSQLRLSFDQLSTTEVPVQVRTEGSPALGFSVSHIQTEPATVSITGPASQLREIHQVTTNAVDISGKSDTIDATVSAFLAAPRVELRSSPLVNVKITLSKASLQ